MPCKNFCNDDLSLLRGVERMVVDTVWYFRGRGHQNNTAIEQAALALGLTPRRTWSIFYEQPVVVAREEFERIRNSFARHLDEQAEDLARRSEAARLRRRQIELEL